MIYVRKVLMSAVRTKDIGVLEEGYQKYVI